MRRITVLGDKILFKQAHYSPITLYLTRLSSEPILVYDFKEGVAFHREKRPEE
jgi:hypothetical protein